MITILYVHIEHVESKRMKAFLKGEHKLDVNDQITKFQVKENERYWCLKYEPTLLFTPSL